MNGRCISSFICKGFMNQVSKSRRRYEKNVNNYQLVINMTVNFKIGA